MLEPAAFLSGTYQAAAFYARAVLVPGKVLPRLLQDLGTVLDGDPISLPIPSNAPPEIPRIILSSKDQALRLEVSTSRVDMRWQRVTDDARLDLGEFTAAALRAFASYQRAIEAHPGRLGFIVVRSAEHENPGRLLAEHFCRPELLSNQPGKKGPLNRPEQFEIHSHKTFTLGQFRLNSWVRFKSGTRKNRPILLVEEDLNTPAQDLADVQFSDDQMREFFSRTALESEAILRLYLVTPGGGR